MGWSQPSAHKALKQCRFNVGNIKPTFFNALCSLGTRHGVAAGVTNPEHTEHWFSVGLMLVQQRPRWHNIILASPYIL